MKVFRGIPIRSLISWTRFQMLSGSRIERGRTGSVCFLVAIMVVFLC